MGNNDLTHKTALLTGGLGTLGKAQAQALASLGVNVVVLDRPDSSDAQREVFPPTENITFIGCDLNQLETAERQCYEKAREVGGFDILINNAALILNMPFEKFSLTEYEEQIRVNSSAAFALARACAPGMKEKGWGKILNFTSVTLTGQWDGYVPYVVSKGAMLGLTKGLARELGPFGINVNAIAPGAVVSDAERRVFGDRLEEYNQWVLDRQCLKKRITPEHIADLVCFLVSPASDMISGQNIAIDGGW